MHVTFRAFRRTTATAVVMFAALFLTYSVTAGGAGAQPPQIEPGIGSALAQTAVVGPSFANLALTFTFGRAIAGHANSVAQASSQAIDLGQIGATLAGRGCSGGDPTLPADKQPQEARVDSRDQKTTVDEDEDFLGGLPMHKHAEASKAPLGTAITTTAPFGVAGVLEIGGGTATATSGVVNGVRMARATTDVGSIKLAAVAGLLELTGLHWEAVWSSATNGVTGSFSIGSAKLAGMALPTNDPAALFSTLNTVLGAVGLKLTPPVSHTDGGVLFVDALGISVVPNAQRDSIAALVLGNIQDLRRQVTDALIAQDCGNATYITIADLVLGSVTGAGVFQIDLGGVRASSGETPKSTFSFGGPQLLTTGGIEPTVGVSTPAVLPPPAIGTITAPPKSRTSRRVAQPIVATSGSGKRGGPMALVGLGGLALLAAIAEGDRRKMRAAQRAASAT